MKRPSKDDLEKVLISIVLAAIFYSGLIFYGDLTKLLKYISEVNLRQMVFVILLTAVSLFLRFLRWDYYLKVQDIQLDSFRSMKYFLLGFSMILTPGKLGEGIKSYLMKKEEDIQIRDSLIVVLAERALDLYSLLIICIGSYLFIFSKSIYSIIVVSSLIILTVIGLKHLNNILSLFEGFSYPKALTKTISYIQKHLDSYGEFLSPKNHLKPFIYSLMAWSANGASLYIILMYLSDVTLSESLLSFSASSVAGALSMIPGGLGVVEGGMSATLQLFGVTRSASVGSTIILRTYSFWLTFLIGAVLLLNHLYSMRRK